jgi:hypothetical protein
MLWRAVCLPHLQLNGKRVHKVRERLDTSSGYECRLSVKLVEQFRLSDCYRSIREKRVSSINIVTMLNRGCSW